MGYIAVVVLLLDLFLLRFWVAGKPLREIPLPIGLLKTFFGILAMVYMFSGFLVALEGVILLIISIANRSY